MFLILSIHPKTNLMTQNWLFNGGQSLDNDFGSTCHHVCIGKEIQRSNDVDSTQQIESQPIVVVDIDARSTWIMMLSDT